MEDESQYLKICEDLKKLVEKTGEPLEGNCVYQHLSFNRLENLLNKRINYREVVKGKKFICEIGFNAGHSILAMILANPNAHFVLFDLGAHAYARPCFEYLKNIFPNTQLEIFWGDSRETLPDYHEKHPDVIFDLIHIDGSHKSEVYTVDWTNSLSMTSSGSFLIFDDTDSEKINAFIEKEIKNGIVKEAEGFLDTFGYKHRILIRK